MQLESYLHFNGNCEEALSFYADVFKGRIDSLNRFEGSPMEREVGDANKKRIMHATLVAGDLRLMASDGMPEHKHSAGSNVSLSLGTSDGAEGERVFNALAQGGKVDMPLQPVFWGGRYGMLTDRFGISWMISIGHTESEQQ